MLGFLTTAVQIDFRSSPIWELPYRQERACGLHLKVDTIWHCCYHVVGNARTLTVMTHPEVQLRIICSFSQYRLDANATGQTAIQIELLLAAFRLWAGLGAFVVGAGDLRSVPHALKLAWALVLWNRG